MRQSYFTKDDLLSCSKGNLFGPNNARLPLANMLMIDRITNINLTGGTYQKGEVLAQLDIHPDLWFFKCHFETDPVMPGCLGIDALWQLLGFYLSWRGNPGKGRALGAGEIKFFGQVLPSAQCVSYHLNIKRIINRKIVVGIANAEVAVDGKAIYTATNLRVGLFVNLETFES